MGQVQILGQTQATHSSQRAMCLIGKDGKGHWVVRGPHGRHSGLFVSRTEALRFAMFDNGSPRPAVMVPGILALNMTQGR